MNRWLNSIAIAAISIYLIDINVMWYDHPLNAMPRQKYTIIGISAIACLILIRVTGKQKDKKQ